MPRSRARDWSRPLAEPIAVGRKTLRTLDDVRTALLNLPEERQQWKGCQYIARLLIEAAEGGSTDLAVPIALTRIFR
jgi:hypothetical protein